MSRRSSGWLAASVLLVALAGCGGGDGSLPSGDGGRGGAGGSGTNGAGGNVCDRLVAYLGKCEIQLVPHYTSDDCTGNDACEAACALQTPCDALRDPANDPAASEAFSMCLRACPPPTTPAGTSGPGGTGGASTSSGSAGAGPSSSHASSSHASSSHASSSSSGSGAGGSGETCPFSAGSIDCDRACSNYLSWCSSIDDCSSGCEFTTHDSCVADCQYEIGGAVSCGIPVWGCYEKVASCRGSAECFLDTNCPGC